MRCGWSNCECNSLDDTDTNKQGVPEGAAEPAPAAPPTTIHRLILVYMYSDLTFKVCMWDNPSPDLHSLALMCHDKFVNLCDQTDDEETALSKISEIVESYDPAEIDKLPITGHFSITHIVTGFVL